MTLPDATTAPDLWDVPLALDRGRRRANHRYVRSGRTQTGNTLEDLGWFVIDNLPVELIPKVTELGGSRGSSNPAGCGAGGGHQR